MKSTQKSVQHSDSSDKNQLEDEEHSNHFSKPAKLVTFGSLVHINMEDNFQLYMYGDGFTNQRLQTRKFESLHGQQQQNHQHHNQNTQQSNLDFTNCVFMVLPFQNIKDFEKQTHILNKLKKDNGQLTKTGDKLDTRKSDIISMKNQLETELGQILININRQTGQKILLINSNFMLLHINTMKYLCLNMESQENLFIELVDEPNKYCFFKFIPCLQLQLMRNDNFVYEEELFYICSSETISGKQPYLITSEKETKEIKNKEDEGWVQGSIDSQKKWKLNLYQEPNLDPPQAESHYYLQAGETMWLLLSEKNFYLSSQRILDPFYEVVQKEQNRKEEEFQKNKQDKKKNQTENKKKLYNIKQIRSKEAEKLGKVEEKLTKKWLDNFEPEFMDKFQAQFQCEDIYENSGESYKYHSSNGLFKIEPMDPFVGGDLEWWKPYRIRHLISGKYLTIRAEETQSQNNKGEKRHSVYINEFTAQEGQNDEKKKTYQVVFENYNDYQNKKFLWSFIPINNLMEKFQSRNKIHKDSYFRLENYETKFQLGFDEETLDPQQSKDFFQYPVLYKFQKDVNTFYFKKCSFLRKWEINFITSAIPVYIDILKYVVYIIDDDEIKGNFKNFPYFDQKYPLLMLTIDKIEEFLKNKILSNIDLQQEYNYPCRPRQDKLREQTLLGLICWTLVKIFPQQREFKKLDLLPDSSIAEVELYGNQFKSKGRKNTMKQQQVHRDRNLKLAEQHLKKRYAICYKLYGLLTLACYKNPDNQNYAQIYLPYLSQHIGQGQFVSESIQACFQDNYIITSSLHRVNFQQEEKDLGQEGQLFGNAEINVDNFFKYMIKRLKKYDAYSKDDILELLGRFCVYKDDTIYINQEKIYSAFVDNRTIIFTTMLKIHTEGDTIYVEIREKENYEYKFNKYKLEDFKYKKPELIEYLKIQMILYANMSANRNYTCGKAFGEMFPSSTLQKYLAKENLDDQIKSIICKLLLNIYIDKEPRLMIQKPNLVRIFKKPPSGRSKKGRKNQIRNQNQNQIQIQNEQQNLYEKQNSNFDRISKLQELEMGKLEENSIKMQSSSDSSDSSCYSEISQDEAEEDKEDIYVNFIKQNSKGVKEELDQIKKIIQEVMRRTYEALQNFQKPEKEDDEDMEGSDIQDSDDRYKIKTEQSEIKWDSVYDIIYNNLNYEFIKTFHVMVKFGMFTSYISPQSQKLLEVIVRFLAFILEYDEDYFKEIKANVPHLKRRYIENEKKVEEKKKNNNRFINVNVPINLSNFTQLGGLLKGDDDDDEEKDSGVSTKRQSQKNKENVTYMKIYDSLFKLLSKYTNKTYTTKDSKVQIDKEIEVKIKLEICQIFEYLQNWREEIYIDKVMDYFNYDFYRQFGNKNIDELQKNQQNFDLYFDQLLPVNMIGVGEEVYWEKKSKGWGFPFTSNDTVRTIKVEEQVKNLDEILNRPFVEVLVMAFYFGKDADLQNSLLNLITRCYSQKKKLVKNLDKINLVAEGESDTSYQKISKLISTLKALHSYAQSWLQIIEQNNYNEKAEDNLDVTLEQFKQLNHQFYEEESDDEDFVPDERKEVKLKQTKEVLYIKQKIFKHLQGFQFVLMFLEQGAQILETNYKYFYLNSYVSTDQNYSYKKSFVQKVNDIFNTCHQILCNFCLYNEKTQKTMFKNYKKLLLNLNYINIGQVNFIQKMFIANKKLINKFQNKEYLHFMVNLIKLHGHHPQFLQLFKIFLDNAYEDTLEVQQLILDLLLDPINLEFIQPFKEEGENMIANELKNIPFYGEEGENMENKREYQELFISIVQQGLEVNIGVNYIVKAYNAIQVKQLLEILNKKTQEYSKIQNDIEQKYENIKIRRTVTNLISIYLKSVNISLNDFRNESETFLDIINLEYKYLQKMVNKGEIYSQSYSDYILNHLTPILIIYADNFLKDATQMAILSIVNDNDYQSQFQIMEFGINLINNLELLIDFQSCENLGQQIIEKLQNVGKLATILKVKVPEKFILLKKVIIELEKQQRDLNQDERKEELQLDHNFDDEIKQNVILNALNLTNENKNFIQKEKINLQKIKAAIKFNKLYVDKELKKANALTGNKVVTKKSKTERTNKPQKVFEKFRQIFKSNKFVKEEIKKEGRQFVISLTNLEKIYSNPKDAKGDILITKEDYIQKFLQYLQNWKQNNSSKQSVVFALKVLRHFVVRCGSEQLNEDQKKIELQSRQIQMDKLKATEIIIFLFWNNTDKDNNYQYYLLRLLISLLEGGNHYIQESIYHIFQHNPYSEKFFYQLSSILNEELKVVKNSNGMETSIGNKNSGQKPLIQNALRVIQLFCEGHYTEMQDYMRQQTNSKVNYDMIVIMVKLLVSFKISNITQSAVQQCLDTLTEIVQGPCKQNQLKIAHSGFLEFAVNILREDDKIFDLKYIWVDVDEFEGQQSLMQRIKNQKEKAKQLQKEKEIQLKLDKKRQVNKRKSKKQQVQPEISPMENQSPTKSNYPLNKFPDLALQEQQYQGNSRSQILQDGDLVQSEKKSSYEIDSVKEGQSSQLLQLKAKDSDGSNLLKQKQVSLMNKAVKEQQQPFVKEAQELQKKRVQKSVKSVHRGYIARIKYKCLITLLSLLECSEDDASINNRIIRTISWQVLLDNITDVYEIYKFKFQDNYAIQAFNKFDNDIDPDAESDPLEDELIIENGFFLYILMVILLENSNKAQLDNQQLQTWEIIKENQTIQEDSETNLLEQSIIGKVSKLLYDLIMKIIIYSAETSKKMAQKAQEALLQNPEEKEKQQKLMIQQYMKQRALMKEESLKFFGSKTCHIEISRENKIQKIYFPKLPYCYLLPKEVKEEFHDECDYSNSKTKLSSFMDMTDDIIKVLQHEQHIQELKKNFFVGMIADNKEIWEQLAFYTTWAINFVILFSYSQKNFDFGEDGENYLESDLDKERRSNPRLFFDDGNNWTINLINILGIFNLAFSGIVVSIFFLRKAPLLLKDMWIDWWENQTTKMMKFLWFIFNLFRSIYICLNNFDFVYYMLFIVIIILGLLVHPFLFGILTLDMLRSRTLKSVVQAIWYPIDTMGLTFLLFLIVAYWFSIFIYMFYYDNFEEGICDSLAICFLRVFDYMFKEGGGVGSFMSEPALESYFDEDLEIWIMQPLTEINDQGQVIVTEVINYVYLGRFFFDFSILFILVILIINMVGGITIDTFKALKQEQQEIEELLNQFCFVCNIEREKLDKAYDVPNGFRQHIKSDHYLWNYLFYKAYILFKSETEYTGNETYVINFINNQDVSWFPIKKSIVIIDEENQESTEKLEAYYKIFNKMKNIKETITSLNVKSRNVMEVI